MSQAVEGQMLPKYSQERSSNLLSCQSHPPASNQLFWQRVPTETEVGNLKPQKCHHVYVLTWENTHVSTPNSRLQKVVLNVNYLKYHGDVEVSEFHLK